MAQGCGTITVETPFDRSAVGIVGCSGLPATAQPAETVTATVGVENGNDTSVEATVLIMSGGTELATKTATLGGNQTTDVTVGFRVPDDAVGDIQIEASLDSVVQGGTGLSLSLSGLLGGIGSDGETADERPRDRPETY